MKYSRDFEELGMAEILYFAGLNLGLTSLILTSAILTIVYYY